MNKHLSALFLSTALTVPMAAFAQSADTACADLETLLSGDVPAGVENPDELALLVQDGDGEACLVGIDRIRTATNEGGDSGASVAETEETTLTLQDEVTVQGRVLLEQTPPRVDVTESEMDVEVEPGAPTVTVAEGQGEIVVRQAPANVTIDMPVPTIRIEQAAPEIIITMPDPVSVGAAQPTVRVVQADPVVSVTQAPAQVQLDLQRVPEGSESTGFEVTDNRTGQAYQSGAAPEEVTTEDAEVTVTKSEPRVVLAEPTENAQVNIERREPTIRFEQAEPVVNFTSAGEPQVEFSQSGEPTVTFADAGETAGEEAPAENTGQAALTAPDASAPAEEPATDPAAEPAEEPASEEPALELTDEPAEEAEGTVMPDATETADAPAGTETIETEAPVELSGPAVEREGYNLAQVGDYEAETLTGSRLYGVADEDIGEIGDLVLADGEISEVIVEIGGFLGLGETQVRIPFERLSILQSNDGDMRVYIDATREELEAMPSAE